MMKVKVSKEVSLILGNARKYADDNLISFMNVVNVNISNNTTLNNDEWLSCNNLTDDDLINAYKYGWEVEYEFQKSDSVFYKNKLCYIDTLDSFKKWCNLSEYNTGLCYEDISFKELKLFCKEENREDLKHE